LHDTAKLQSYINDIFLLILHTLKFIIVFLEFVVENLLHLVNLFERLLYFPL
jgi:hypothetical protein